MADQRLGEFLTEHARIKAEEQAGTVSGLIDHYLAHKGYGVGSVQEYHLRGIRRLLGGLTPAGLTPRVLKDYERQRGVRGSTARRDLGALVAVLNLAVRHKLLDPADAPHIDLPPPGAPRERCLTEAEAARFWELAMGHSEGRPRLSRLTRFVCIAMETAARKEAIEGLAWDRVNLARRLIDFRDPTLPRTKKRRVPVPISNKLFPVLEQAWREREAGERFVVGQGSIRKTFETFLAGADGGAWKGRLTPHTFRHTWATLAAQRAVPMVQIAAVLGDNLATVEKHYLHLSPEYLRDAVNPRPVLGSHLRVVPGGKEE